MRVTAAFHGVLSGFIGTERAEFELGEGALYGDLLTAIARGWRRNMPDQMWDDQAVCFRKPILATSGGRTVADPATPLQDGQEIKFLLMAAGG